MNLKHVTLGVLISLGLSSCKDEEIKNETLGLESLKEVQFKKAAERKVGSIDTGTIQFDPSDGKNKKVYLTTIEKPFSLNPLRTNLMGNNDAIYPGSILQGKSFMQGKYDPLVLDNDFNPITLSISLQGAINVSDETIPTLANVRYSLNNLIPQQHNNINFDYVASNFQYESNKVSTIESFKKSLKIHLEASLFKGLVESNFDYKASQEQVIKSNKVLVSFTQKLYSVSIDPKHYSNWIQGDINTKKLGEYEPVYISNVDYGRSGWILVTTTKSSEEVKKMVSASIKASFTSYVDGGVGVNYTKEFNKLFKEGNVQIHLIGGPANLANNVNDVKTFQEFIKLPKLSEMNSDVVKELVQTAAPISYKVRRLKDNTEINVQDTYTVSVLELK